MVDDDSTSGGSSSSGETSGEDTSIDPFADATLSETTAGEDTAAGPSVTPPESWWDGAWPCRIPFTIAAPSTLAAIDDAVVLARLDTQSLAPPLASEQGVDVRVLAEDHHTVLPFEVDEVRDGELLLWLGVAPLTPEVEHRGWLYYGNAAAPADVPPSPWAGAYDAVLHLGPSLADSTGAHMGSASPEPTHVVGQIGGARSFRADQPTRAVHLADSRDFDWAGGFSLSFWTFVGSGNDRFTRRGFVGSIAWGLEVYDDLAAFMRDAPLSFRLRVQCMAGTSGCSTADGGPTYTLGGSSALVANWHHIALTVAPGEVRLYIDGSLASATPLDVGFVMELHDLSIGSDPGSTRMTYGSIDEFRFYEGVWPAERIAADYTTMRGELVTFGTPECFRR